MKTVVRINKNWPSEVERKLQAGLLSVTTEIHKRSAILAPKDTRALVNSGIIKPFGRDSYVVQYGSTRVPYARRRHFENRKNPQTIGYLALAGDSVTRGDLRLNFRGL